MKIKMIFIVIIMTFKLSSQTINKEVFNYKLLIDSNSYINNSIKDTLLYVNLKNELDVFKYLNENKLFLNIDNNYLKGKIKSIKVVKDLGKSNLDFNYKENKYPDFLYLIFKDNQSCEISFDKFLNIYNDFHSKTLFGRLYYNPTTIIVKYGNILFFVFDFRKGYDQVLEIIKNKSFRNDLPIEILEVKKLESYIKITKLE